jgi:hypothetical protein|tara:strand:+ start:4045 stop:4416 length:372 start_codon:yes stop_codon:yes gene_type:complete
MKERLIKRMSETYHNRNYHQTRATRDMAEKRSKLVKESKFCFISAIVDHYAYLMDLKKEEFNLEFNTYMSHMRYTGRKKFKRQHDKLLEMAIMKACSDHYEDYNDNNLSNFVKTYIAGKNMSI